MSSTVFKAKKGLLFGFLSPGIALYVFIIILPLFFAIRYSLFKWSGGPNMEFIGLQNYVTLVQDGDFWRAFKNNMILIVVCIIFQIGISFILSMLLSSALVKLKKFHRIAIFLPVVISPVVVGILWKLIYNKDLGLLNWFLKSVKLDFMIQGWLDDPAIVMYSISAVIIWQYMGIYLMIFLAGIQGIPPELYESAAIDGASGIQRAVYITLPQMYNVLKVAVMLSISGNMKVFDHIFIMTGGGPGKSSTVVAQYAYTNSFTMFKFGYGNAISIGMIILSLTIILISRKLMPSNND